MSYMQYCLGLAALNGDSALTEDDALAYAIGSLDRLHRVKLPRCRKEVEDAIAALSDPNYVTMTQQWQERCDRLQAERDEYHNQLDEANEVRWFLDIQKAFIEAYGSDEFDRLCEKAYADKLNPDGKVNLVSANSAIFCAMAARLPVPK